MSNRLLQAFAKIERKWFWVGGALLALGTLGAFGLRRSDPIQYVSAAVQRGEIRDGVDATGTVNAVIMVLVGSQVSGTISKLNVDFNSRVHKGDIIAEIDPSLLQGALLQSRADLESAKANVLAAEANLAKANATLTQATADNRRVAGLATQGMASQQDADLATANFASAKAGVDGAAAGVALAKAQVSQKSAAVAIAQANLDHSIIRSPIDGIVVARNVDVGQTVAASLQAPTLFTIAQDLTQMLVYVKVDESDVGRIHSGQPTTFKVDAFPKDAFEGKVSQVRMNPTSVQNVVTYDAIIAFQNPDLKLFPGMTAYVNIPVATVDDAVKLPNAALRYRPAGGPEVIRALYTKYGIEDRGAGRDSSRGAPAAVAHAPPTAHEPTATAVVWKLHSDNTVEPVQVALGITDHAFTEVVKVLKGELKAGDEVVTTSISAKSSSPGAPGAAGARR